jgi:acyl-CoA dehydrogenase
MQIMGGAGYLRGNAVERIYREVKVQAIGGGSEEIMRDLSVRLMGI